MRRLDLAVRDGTVRIAALILLVCAVTSIVLAGMPSYLVTAHTCMWPPPYDVVAADAFWLMLAVSFDAVTAIVVALKPRRDVTLAWSVVALAIMAAVGLDGHPDALDVYWPGRVLAVYLRVIVAVHAVVLVHVGLRALGAARAAGARMSVVRRRRRLMAP